MKNILGTNYFSIEWFNEEGLIDVSYFTGLDFDEVEYESSIGNFLVGQTEIGSYFLFCEPSGDDIEITYNEFKNLLAKN